MIFLDHPTAFVPVDALNGLLEAVDRYVRQQDPFDRLHSFRGIHLAHTNHPCLQWYTAELAARLFWSAGRDWRPRDRDRRLSNCMISSGWHLDCFVATGRQLPRKVVKLCLLAIFPHNAAVMLRTYEI